ncbi:MAG TPA: MarR family transcriptional regulator [Pseudolysinimonas sp.]|nr:MarR family transcriptional regulator [Pseudolysinimonas sp.]
MADELRSSDLFELADSILAISRYIHASKSFAVHGWTPIESAVMRFVDRNPGTTASAAAEATQLISSNFSRALRLLEKKGLVRREIDPEDGRRVRLFPTESAQENLRLLHELWTGLLDGVVDDRKDLVRTNAFLRRVEAGLVARAAGSRPPHPG